MYTYYGYLSLGPVVRVELECQAPLLPYQWRCGHLPSNIIESRITVHTVYCYSNEVQYSSNFENYITYRHYNVWMGNSLFFAGVEHIGLACKKKAITSTRAHGTASFFRVPMK